MGIGTENLFNISGCAGWEESFLCVVRRSACLPWFPHRRLYYNERIVNHFGR